MPWNTLTNLSSGTIVTETHMDQIRENIEWTGGFGSGGTPFSGFGSAFTNLARIAIGTYTGNGASTQAITGVGFQPRCMLVTASGIIMVGGVSLYVTATGYITSFDANGFTVNGNSSSPTSSGALNVNTEIYRYFVFR